MIGCRKIFTLIFFVILYSQPIKINDCSIEDLEELPLSKEKIESIMYRSGQDSVVRYVKTLLDEN